MRDVRGALRRPLGDFWSMAPIKPHTTLRRRLPFALLYTCASMAQVSGATSSAPLPPPFAAHHPGVQPLRVPPLPLSPVWV